VRIDQFVPSFVRHDAISNHVLQVRKVLRGAGYDSELWYEAAEPRAAGEGRNFGDCPLGPDPERVILYHASTHSEMAAWLETAAAHGQTLAIDYHNITPPAYFARWEPAAAASMSLARKQLARLLPKSGLAIADSAFNESELIALGHSNTAVCPIILDLEEYHAEPDKKTLDRLRREPGHLWLFVGRIAPNKCQHDVIAAFAVYRRLFDPAARLALIGAPTSLRYWKALKTMASELGIADAVQMPDSTPFRELLSFYHGADVFVCLSGHEGFCVPIVEAMELGLPVVAARSSAVGETVGDGGVVLDGKDPLEVAVAVDTLLSDDGLRQTTIAAGRARAGDFALGVSAKKMLATIERWTDMKDLG
jgi:L-malate glycosyltransferase